MPHNPPPKIAKVGPDMVVDMNYAMAAHVAPAMATYLTSNLGTIRTDKVRADLRIALDALDAAAGHDDVAYLEAASKLAGMAALLVYLRTGAGLQPMGPGSETPGG